MKKIIYVGKDYKKHGDCFDVCITFDKNEALDKTDSDRMHLTKQELKRSEHFVEGFELDIPEGMTAEEAWSWALDEDLPETYNPVFCEKVLTKEEVENDY